MSESSGSGKSKKGFWKLAVFLVVAVLLGLGDFFLLIRLSNRTVKRMITERVATYEVIYSNDTTQQMRSETDIEILEKKKTGFGKKHISALVTAEDTMLRRTMTVSMELAYSVKGWFVDSWEIYDQDIEILQGPDFSDYKDSWTFKPGTEKYTQNYFTYYYDMKLENGALQVEDSAVLRGCFVARRDVSDGMVYDCILTESDFNGGFFVSREGLYGHYTLADPGDDSFYDIFIYDVRDKKVLWQVKIYYRDDRGNYAGVYEGLDHDYAECDEHGVVSFPIIGVLKNGDGEEMKVVYKFEYLTQTGQYMFRFSIRGDRYALEPNPDYEQDVENYINGII